MNTLGNALLVAMPAFYLLILLEMMWAAFVKGDRVNMIDSISSVSSGITNVLKTTLGLTIVVISYPWLQEHVSVMHWENNSAAAYIITFVILDFIFYWMHRLSHQVNFFWNHHVVHHSSEEFNLPCALRQNITIFTNITSITLLPLAVLGIEERVLLTAGPIHLFAQFWYHTRYIGKMGFLEHIIVTPSHHRAHHAMNDIYLDKNFGAIFIIWDKLFGTFQEELESEPCVFGMRRPARSWNPFIINFKHYWSLIKDAWNTKELADKFRIWVMPTGWRPADVAEKDPIFTIGRMDELRKYDPTYSRAFVAFSFLHLNVIFLLVCFLFSRFGEIQRQGALTYGMLLFAAVFGFTAILDKRLMGVVSHNVLALIVIGICAVYGNWFGLNTFLPYGSNLLGIYFLLSALLFTMFYVKELRATRQEFTVSAESKAADVLPLQSIQQSTYDNPQS
jgi:alkylglycerol monooxygenase